MSSERRPLTEESERRLEATGEALQRSGFSKSSKRGILAALRRYFSRVDEAAEKGTKKR